MVDQRVAPLGYAYYLVDDGQATLATCMPAHVGSWRPYLEAAVGAFARATGHAIDVRASDARFFAGTGSLYLGPRFLRDGHPVAGEAAGVQDAMWGFGIRNAVTSGHLAARSLLEGVDYVDLAEAEIAPHVRAGIANRFLWERLGDRGFAWLIAKTVAHPNPPGCMRWGFGPRPVKDRAYETLLRRYRGRTGKIEA